jgi:hypothetical protein
MLELCCIKFFHIGTKKQTFYPNDVNVIIYAELLTRTDPPTLRRGVTREVINKFDVPLRTVQDIWHKGVVYKRLGISWQGLLVVKG